MVSSEVRPGLLIISTSILALLMCNLGYEAHYFSFWNHSFKLNIGALSVDKSLLAIVNEGLMAIFFLLITIEIRYAFLYGFLNNRKYMMLPLAGALGGIVAPALIYILFNYQGEELIGWAIPVATDVAFSLACLMLLGSRFSPKLRIFLLSLAIFDDLAAIIIIGIFYSSSLSFQMLLLASIVTLLLFGLRYFENRCYFLYFALGACLWVALLKSGVHATLAGSILALMLPVSHDKGRFLKNVYENLLPIVQYGILPLFTFANSGVVLKEAGHSPTLFLGIVFGLIIGKPLGIVSFTYLSTYFKLSAIPKEMNYHQILGVSFLCGIGFTMSLFIGSLAFEGNLQLLNTLKVSVLLASFIASVLGMTYLYTFGQEKT